MSWGKIDDQFHAHRKAKKAWKATARSLGLHVLAISYCAGHLTDGLVDLEFVEEKLPVARERVRATKALVDAGLWVLRVTIGGSTIGSSTTRAARKSGMRENSPSSPSRSSPVPRRV
jgi:hypothetical protein